MSKPLDDGIRGYDIWRTTSDREGEIIERDSYDIAQCPPCSLGVHQRCMGAAYFRGSGCDCECRRA